MSNIVIIANGEPPQRHDLARWLHDGDVLICADGGARTALAHDLRPHHVIGDFDSLTSDMLGELEARGARLHRFPTRKNETDLELALLLAAHHQPKPDAIIVLGAFGGRLDHALANMLLLSMPALKGHRVFLVHGPERAFLIDAREHPTEVTFEAEPGDLVSLLPFGGDAHDIHTEGLEYPLRGEPLYIGPARGVSNVMLGKTARVAVGRGLLLCVIRSQGADLPVLAS
ncbi:MAG: thiamine diphosphokinase [Anaerolineae bacterium]|nr:thiamine diphosphokinase [Thermoflexales bacterium]MDW8396843.1 thiamine diphosphokinase [Anaerolineae bacterium]